MSTFELVSSIKDSLSKRGVLNSIRAQLKAGILEAINDENVPLSFKSNERAAAFLGDKAGRVSFDVVKELLESLELKHTLSALHAELGIASSAVDREGSAKELHAPLDYSSKEPLLLHLVQTSRSSSSLSSPKVRATSTKAVGASPASPTVVAPLPLDREPVAVAASKTLSQRRAISLSVSPDKSSSPPSSKSPALSPVAQSEFGGSNKPRSPSSLPSPVGSSDSRSRAGILNPLPQVTLASSSKQLVAAPTAGGGKLGQVLALAKGGKLLNLSDNGPLQSAEVQQISQFLASQTQLESLHLGNCGITDDAFTQLFESIRRLAKLKEINLANNALTTVDPHLFLLPSLKSCVLDGNRLPPVLSEATFAELRMYGKQKTQLSAASISSQDGPEESDDHDISSSFEIDSPEKQPGMQKARSPLSSLSRVVEVHSKTSADKVEINNSTVQRDARGSVARSKSGWGSSGSARGGDERDTTDDDDFVFAEDGNKTGGVSGGESSSSGARRLINPLNNRATSRPRGTSARQSPGGDDLLEQSIGSKQEESDILQRSYVSNQEEEIETLPSIAQNVKSVAAKSKAAVEYADEYGEDDFEDIEEDFSVQDEVSELVAEQTRFSRSPSFLRTFLTFLAQHTHSPFLAFHSSSSSPLSLPTTVARNSMRAVSFLPTCKVTAVHRPCQEPSQDSSILSKARVRAAK